MTASTKSQGPPDTLTETLGDLDGPTLRGVRNDVDERLDNLQPRLQEQIRTEANGEVVDINDCGAYTLVRNYPPSGDDSRDFSQPLILCQVKREKRPTAEYLYRAVTRPEIVDCMSTGEGAEVFETDVGSDAPIAAKTVQHAGDGGLLGDDVLIVAIEHEGEDEPITPRGNTRIGTGDRLTVYSGTGATPEITDVFGHYENPATTDFTTATKAAPNPFNNV